MTGFAVFFGSLMVGLPMLFGWADFFGEMGSVLALGIAAAGSAIGLGLAGQAAAGAWAKEARAGRNLNFTYIILTGMPMSQTLYALIIMNNMSTAVANGDFGPGQYGLLFGIGIGAGLAEMLSAWMQGMVGAAGIRALSDGENKVFAFVIIAMGIVETVGIFAMVFLLGMIPS